MNKGRYPYWRNRREDDFFDDFWPQVTTGHQFDIFDEFEEQFKRIQQRMNNLYRGTLKGDFEVTAEGEPQVYGWTYRVGSNGRPVFQEFGNVSKTSLSNSEELQGSREPLIDVQESDRQITIIAEMPGVSKEDVNLKITGDVLIMRVDTPKRKYYKEVQLPAEIDQDRGNARFNNGVLSVTLDKLRPKKKGKKLKVD